MAPPPEDISAGSILRELIFNQYQAIVAAGAVAASALTLNPLPLLLWLGSEMVLLPILDSGPLRRLVARRRRERGAAAVGRAAQERDRLLRRRPRQALRVARRAVPDDRDELPGPDRHFAGVSLRTARQTRQHPGRLSPSHGGVAALREDAADARPRRSRRGDRQARARADRRRPQRARARGAAEEPRVEAAPARVVLRRSAAP